MCAKVQVAFDVSAPLLDRPLGTPILFVSIASEGDVRRLHLCSAHEDGMMHRGVWRWPVGQLTGDKADRVAVQVGDALYNLLIFREGFQEELELLERGHLG